MRVYAGIDPLTGRRHYLQESAATPAEAERVRTRLLAQVDERRNPRTKATVNQMLDRYLEVAELERTTRKGYEGKIAKHIRPELGELQVGRLDAELLESFYALLRRCREHCRGRKLIEHRTTKPHECRTVRHRRRPGRPGTEPHDCEQAGCTVVECQPHECKGLSAGSILVAHAILSGALELAVRWRWISVNPA